MSLSTKARSRSSVIFTTRMYRLGKKTGDEVASKVAGHTIDAVANATATRLREKALNGHKAQLTNWVKTAANRPLVNYDCVVDSVAFQGLQSDYLSLCAGYQGGLLIVYDHMGTGKSFALQAVARAKSRVQPDRFLVINIQGSRSCQDLYEFIKLQVLGKVQDFEFSSDEVAEVIYHGLCGDPIDAKKKLPKTRNSCRLRIDATVHAIEKNENFPILVIDEFNPLDFTEDDWQEGKDYSLRQLDEKMGDAFKFFNALVGLAHQANGFAVLVGTKNEAVARALHKINGGTKAMLARCTTGPRTPSPDGNFPFDDWRGFQWSNDDKAKVVRALFQRKYKSVLLDEGRTDDEAEIATEDTIRRLCSTHQSIRMCCIDMQDAVTRKQCDATTLMASRTQSPTSEGCCSDFKEQVENANCVII